MLVSRKGFGPQPVESPASLLTWGHTTTPPGLGDPGIPPGEGTPVLQRAQLQRERDALRMPGVRAAAQPLREILLFYLVLGSTVPRGWGCWGCPGALARAAGVKCAAGKR